MVWASADAAGAKAKRAPAAMARIQYFKVNRLPKQGLETAASEDHHLLWLVAVSSPTNLNALTIAPIPTISKPVQCAD
jgi:hypothetical protein